MKAEIKHWRYKREAKAMSQVLRWQAWEVICREHFDVMRITQGVGTPVLYVGGVVVATGFRDMVRYLDEHKLWRTDLQP